MQIFEITQRKTVNEGVLSAIGKAVGNKAIQAATGLSGQLDEPASGPNARMAAFKATSTAAGPLAKQMQLAWAQTVQELMSRSKDAAGAPSTKASDIDPNDLKQQLDTMINNMVRAGKDYKQVGAGVEDPTAKDATLTAQDAISKGTEAILKATSDPRINANQTTQLWLSLVQNGIVPLQQIAQFDKTTNAPTSNKEMTMTRNAKGEWLVNGQPYNPKDPVHAAAYASLPKTGGATA